MHNIGKQIKHVRQRRSLTQYGLAERAGISRSYLADLERGKYNPTLGMLNSICGALHISVVELLGENTADSRTGF
jgi:transcriptional regulator with XRE-family HTH domain